MLCLRQLPRKVEEEEVVRRRLQEEVVSAVEAVAVPGVVAVLAVASCRHG